MPIKPIQSVNENSTCRLQFALVNQNDSAVPNTSINSAFMTLKEQRSNNIINNRSSADVKSLFSSTGHFDMFLDTSDNKIIHNTSELLGDVPFEYHVATFTISVLSGGDTVQLVDEIWIKVNNLRET